MQMIGDYTIIACGRSEICSRRSATRVNLTILHATSSMQHVMSNMLHVTFACTTLVLVKNGGQKKDLSFVCYCGNSSEEKVGVEEKTVKEGLGEGAVEK